VSIRTLHIGRVWQSPEAGGADRILFDLSRYLPRYDVELEAIVTTSDGQSEPADSGVFSAGSARGGTRARWLGTRRAVKTRLTRGRFDVVASHFALYASAVLDKLRGVPHVVHFHGPWAAESRAEGAGQCSCATKWAIERLVYGSADRIIVLSHAFAAVVEHTYGVKRARIRVVPGAVDLERFAVDLDREQSRRILGLPEQRTIVVAVRRLVQRTGLDRLIEALPAVVEQCPELLLCVAGKGPMRQQLDQQIARLGLAAHVLFLGYVKDEHLPFLYRSANLNIVPTSSLEGFGLTAIEALAAGTPSIVTPVGGLPEAVSALSAALVLRSNSQADIADGLIRAISGATPMPSVQQCREFARDCFSADLMARRTAAVYEEVCA
jgi:glycosyltransferase involved in cell wall biosynthesis